MCTIHQTGLPQDRYKIAMRLRKVALLAKIAVLILLPAVPALAASQPFTCALQSDGKTVRVTIANPYARDAQCMVDCQFSTQRAGTTFLVSCGKSVPAGGVETELCVKTYDKGVLVKMIGGTGDCTDPVPKDSPAVNDDDDKDDEELIQRLQKQGQDFIDRQKSKD